MKLIPWKTIPKYHSSFIFTLQFSLNQDFLFSGGKSKVLKMLDLDSLEQVAEFPFQNYIFWSAEHHNIGESSLFVLGKNNKITRKFHLRGQLREKLVRRKYHYDL